MFGHFRKSQRVKFDTEYLKSTTRQHWIRFSCYFLENMVLTVFFGIFQNPFVSSWYYYLPLLSNIETQVAIGQIWFLTSRTYFECPLILADILESESFLITSDSFSTHISSDRSDRYYGWPLQVSSIFYCKAFSNQRFTWFLLNVNPTPRFLEVKSIQKNVLKKSWVILM